MLYFLVAAFFPSARIHLLIIILSCKTWVKPRRCSDIVLSFDDFEWEAGFWNPILNELDGRGPD